MAYEQKDMTGSLFVNDRKQSERQPDRTGSALIGGVEYYVSGWIKQGRSGQFLSLAFKPKDQRQPGEEPRGAAPSLNDDIPF